MGENKTNPLGYERIGKLMLRFSLPAVASNLLNSVYNIEDQIVIGLGIGHTGIAATNVAFPMSTLTTALSLLVGVGCASNFNLSLGAGDYVRARKIAGTSLTLSVLIGIVIATIALVFIHPLLRLFGANEEIYTLAKEYIFITAFGIPFQTFALTACQLIRADGSPNWTMVCMMAGAALNIIGDPILMFVFHVGFRGMAITSAVGPMLTALLGLGYLIRGLKTVKLQKEDFFPGWKETKSIAALGISGFSNQIAITIISIIMNNTLTHYGDLSRYGSTIALAAVGAISKINTVIVSLAVGIGQGCQPINGFNYGAQVYSRVRKTLITALGVTTLMSVGLFAIFQIFPRAIVSVFGQDSEEYLTFASRYLRIYMFMTFANAVQPITSGFFTSTGRAKVGMFISMTRQIICLLPLLIVLPILFGIDGVMFAGPIADGIAAGISGIVISREIRRLGTLKDDPIIPLEPPPEFEVDWLDIG